MKRVMVFLFTRKGKLQRKWEQCLNNLTHAQCLAWYIFKRYPTVRYVSIVGSNIDFLIEKEQVRPMKRPNLNYRQKPVEA